MGRQHLTIAAIFSVSVILLCCSCSSGNNHTRTATDTAAVAPEPEDLPLPPAPPGYRLIANALGDLDGDGTVDLAIAWSGPDSDTGAGRRLMLYQAGSTGWDLWHQSAGPVMGSMQDARSGDPFHSLEITNGAIVIRHAGGSREHWTYLHSYRFQDSAWQLVSAVITSGELCDTFTTIDYDLVTGAVDVNRESNNCDDTGTEVPGKGDARLQQFSRRQGPVDMDGFIPGANALVAPDRTCVYY